MEKASSKTPLSLTVSRSGYLCSRSLVIRADADPHIGGGHVMRCLTLAKRFTLSGWHCSFAVNHEALHVVPELERSGFEVVVLTKPGRSENLIKHFPKGIDLLIVDHYGLDADFESSCRGWAKTVLVIDDLADRAHDCDLLVDTTPGRTAESYNGLVPEGCRFLLGPEYAPLRDDFSLLRPATLACREQNKHLERVLVSFGLTDPKGVTAKAVQGIVKSGSNAEVDIILSHSAPGYEHVARLANQNEKLRLFDYVDDMAALLSRSDLALGAAGTTSWERCCLGLPTILVVVADNQESNAKGLENSGAAANLGPADDLTVEDISRALINIANNDVTRLAMARAAAGLCDGLGATRVALTVHNSAEARDGGSVHLRLARAEDMKIMFEWQTHPDTRRFARNPEPPCLEEHKEWFERKMEDKNCELLVILYKGLESGVFRLDRLANGAREVSIVVAPGLRGLGIGSAVLSFANGFWPGVELHAEILPGNEASRRMFLAAGYEKAGETTYVRAN